MNKIFMYLKRIFFKPHYIYGLDIGSGKEYTVTTIFEKINGKMKLIGIKYE